jgi:hypothetical protein
MNTIAIESHWHDLTILSASPLRTFDARRECFARRQWSDTLPCYGRLLRYGARAMRRHFCETISERA